MTAAILNATTLGKTVLYSLIAGVGVAVFFAVAVSSAAGLAEARREHRTASGLAWGALMVACLVCVAGGIAVGIVAMAQKG